MQGTELPLNGRAWAYPDQACLFRQGHIANPAALSNPFLSRRPCTEMNIIHRAGLPWRLQLHRVAGFLFVLITDSFSISGACSAHRHAKVVSLATDFTIGEDEPY
jgi:hypothetical protein